MARQPQQPDRHPGAPRQLEAFLRRVPERVLVVLDEAYNEYIKADLRGEPVKWLRRHPNLVVTRTFSKAYGLAGLRVGYALAHPSVADVMNRVRQPFNVNSIGLAAAAAALDDMEFVARSYAENLNGMRQLEEGARALGLAFIASYGNFLTIHVATGGKSAAEIFKRLLRRGVIVRPIAGYAFPSICASPSARRRRTRNSSPRLRRASGNRSQHVVRARGRHRCSLIGGSFALALKQAKACAHVVGAGRSGANLTLALERGVIDSIAPDAVAAAHGADLVLLAAPVAQFPKLFRDVSSVLGPKSIVTDGGSTKRDVVVAARAAMGKKVAQFVPAHPIAGAEKSGAGAASADLFPRQARDHDAAAREFGGDGEEGARCMVGLRRPHHADGSRCPRHHPGGGQPPAACAGIRAGA